MLIIITTDTIHEIFTGKPAWPPAQFYYAIINMNYLNIRTLVISESELK